MIGKKKTASIQSTLWEVGRPDLRISTARWLVLGGLKVEGARRRTSNDDIENQDNEADYSTSRTVLPGVTVDGGGGDFLSHSEGKEGKL